MKKRILVSAVILLLVAGLGFANGSKEAAVSDSGKKQLTMWFWGAATPYQEAMKNILEGWYNGSQDQYELTIEFRNTVDKDIPVALAAKSGPDIVYASGPSYTSVYVQEGLVKNLDQYAKQYGWQDQVLSVMYDACTVDGSLYSVPGGVSIGGLYYNKSLFAEKGWEPPTTWDEMISIFDAAKADGIYPLSAGNKGWKPCNEHFSSMIINHFGGRDLFYDALEGTIPFTDPRIVAAVEESKDWYQKGYLAGNDYVNLDSQEVMQLLADKRAAMVMAPSLYTQFAGQSFLGADAENVGFINMPSLDTDEAVYDVSMNCNFSINANSKYPDEAAKILNFMLSNDFSVEMTKVWPGYWVLPIKSLVNYDASGMTGLSKMSIASFQEAIGQIDAGYFAYHPSTFFPSATVTEFRNIDTVWDGVVSSADFCAAVDKELQSDISQGLVCPLVDPTK